MSATFDGWLNASVRTEFVLCELEPTKTVMGFGAAGGGLTNTFSLAFSRFHQTTIIKGGIYGRVVGVLQNDIVLTERASAALVDANAGSYFWDETAELLYVRTTTSADPDTFTLIQVAVRFYLANAPVTLERVTGTPSTAIYYEPWLTNDLPRVRRQREDLLFGQMQVPEGNVSFTNGHGAWWTLVAPDGPWNWKNRPARFFIGGEYNGQALTRDQYAAMAAMRIEDTAPNEAACQFMLSPVKRFADIELPITPFFADTYPNLGDGVEGTKKWIGYGRATMRPDLTDTTGLGIYTIADAAFQTLAAVHQAWAIEKATGLWTPLILSTHYTVDLTLCTLTVISATYTHEDYEIAVDVTGLPFTVFADIVEDILTRFLNVTAADLDAASFATAAVDNPNELAFWIKEPRALRSILASGQVGFPSLGRSAIGTVQETVDGKWTTSIWNADVDGIDVTLQRSDFARFEPKPKLKAIFPILRVFYNFDHARESWSVVEVDDPATRYRTGSEEALDLYTFLRNQSDAQRLAEKYQLIAGGVTVDVAFAERGALLCRKEGGGKALVNFTPAPSASGAYVNQPMEILEAEIVMAPKLSVSGRLGNLHGLAGRVGTWMADAAPDYTAATPEERLASGFWCDDNGFANPADLNSGGRSIWW